MDFAYSVQIHFRELCRYLIIFSMRWGKSDCSHFTEWEKKKDKDVTTW